MKDMKEIVNFLKVYGFVYPNSNIYDGFANTWDFGPLGSILKENIKEMWKRSFIFGEENCFLLDNAIFMNPKVWEASGHLQNFNDFLIDCKNCKQRYRADYLILEQKKINVENKPIDEINKILKEKKIKCPNCNSIDLTKARNFQLMFQTQMGLTTSEDNIYLRPELAQGIFINFPIFMKTMRPKLPFGIGQIGKSFRNEITPGNFIFRTKEFEQLELEFFVKPKESKNWFEYWVKKSQDFLVELGINPKKIFVTKIPQNQLAHYSQATIDIQYQFPFGQRELMGIANRGDYDLKRHFEKSKIDFFYLDTSNNTKIMPYVIEPSMGVERLFLAIIMDAFVKEKFDKEERIVLKLNKSLAPYKLAILPLTNKQEHDAKKLYSDLVKKYKVPLTFDRSGSIGKRYRRQDAIGTLNCVTVDFDFEKNQTITIRDRDTMKQKRILISEIKNYL